MSLFAPIQTRQQMLHPSEYPEEGAPAEMPMEGAPAQMPNDGGPGQMPMSGGPGQMPMEGEPSQMPMEGDPAMMPEEYPSEQHAMNQKPKYSVGDPMMDKYINMFIS